VTEQAAFLSYCCPAAEMQVYVIIVHLDASARAMVLLELSEPMHGSTFHRALIPR
jgi:hypothetical protein